MATGIAIAVIPIILAFLVALIITVYYLAYKRRINKTVVEDRPMKKPMAEPKSVANVLLTVLIAVAGVGIFTLLLVFLPSRERIHSLENRVNVLEQQVDAAEQRFILLNSDDREKDGTVKSANSEVVGFNKKTRKATVKFSVRLKRSTPTTKVSVAVDDEEFELKKIKTTLFEGTHELDAFTDYSECENYIIVSNDSAITTHSADDFELDELYTACFPNITAYKVIFGNEHKPSRGNYSLDVSFYVHTDESKVVKFKVDAYKLAVYRNEELVKEEKVPVGVIDNNRPMGIKADIPFDKNDSIYVYLFVEDTAGFTHKIQLYSMEDLDANGEPGFEQVVECGDDIVQEMFDKDGKLLTND